MTLYLDVLLIINIYVNYFLLKATAKITHTKLRTSRNIVASVIGSVFSVVILLPPFPSVISLLIKLFAAAVIVCITFGFADKVQFLKLLFFFYTINFIFAGVMFAIYTLTEPSFMGFNNAYFYIDFSLLTLIISTIIAYLGVSLVRYLLDKKALATEKYTLIIKSGGQTATLNAFADTGNTLVDIFTGQPIILCSAKKLDAFIPYELKEKLLNPDINEFQNLISQNRSLKGLRIMPFSTVNSSGLIFVFSPDSIYIKAEKTDKIKNVNAKIGISQNQDHSWEAIFNPNLIL